MRAKVTLVGALVGVGLGVGAIAWRLHATPEPHPVASTQGSAEPPASESSEPPDAGPPKPQRTPLSRPDDVLAKHVHEQRERLYGRMREVLGYGDKEIAALRAIIDPSTVISQGNPDVSKHPMTRSECYSIREKAGLMSTKAQAELAEKEKTCGARYMVPVTGRPGVTPVCIDQYEFPDIPCEYPVVYPSAKQASELCHAVGKRLCDAHEWEGACAGELLKAEDEYLWDRPRRVEMAYFKNEKREKVWAYGKEKDHSLCATGSHKSPKCNGGGWETCGSNTYPAGAFPKCVSSFGVYDQHGNAAEHMNLPMKPEELGSRGGLGETEMKGSWFIFLREEAHEDDCRWRAPAWHATRVDDPMSHMNYHLGFRCCKDIEK